MSSVKDRVFATVTKNVSAPTAKVVTINAPVAANTDTEHILDFAEEFSTALQEKLEEVLPDTRVLRFELTPAQALERLKTVAPELLAVPLKSVQCKTATTWEDTLRQKHEEVLAAAELGISVHAYRHFTQEISRVRELVGMQATRSA